MIPCHLQLLSRGTCICSYQRSCTEQEANILGLRKGGERCKRTCITNADALHAAILSDPLKDLVNCHCMTLSDVLLHL